ncbi:MAG TPA: hypothetical protein VJ715_13225 [Pyrinomonadaceae bacterium]|nr:hypothetical protein [Pyrinomonadaceae bacterium]
MSEEITQNIPDGRSFEERVMARFDALDTSMQDMRTSMRDMNARLTALEERVDQRLKETRPIWEQVLVRLDAMEKRFGRFERNMDNLNRKFRVFNEDILTWQNQQEDMEERVSKLESEPAK